MAKSAYIPPKDWTPELARAAFDKTGRRRQLNFDTCYPLIKGDRA